MTIECRSGSVLVEQARVEGQQVRVGLLDGALVGFRLRKVSFDPKGGPVEVGYSGWRISGLMPTTSGTPLTSRSGPFPYSLGKRYKSQHLHL